MCATVSFLLFTIDVHCYGRAAGQHLCGHPVLESACALELRAEDEGIEAALVYIEHLLNSSVGKGALF